METFGRLSRFCSFVHLKSGHAQTKSSQRDYTAKLDLRQSCEALPEPDAMAEAELYLINPYKE